MRAPRLMVMVGGPGSGKDFAIQGVNDLGAQHAKIVAKHTSRERKADDGSEMICADDAEFALERCDVVYDNFGTKYGLETRVIWEGLRGGAHQVAVVSGIDALNLLKERFGELMVLIYVHSETTAEQFESEAVGSIDYVASRVRGFREAADSYVANFLAFDHVLIWSGDRENLVDQIFRLFRAYETGLL